MEKRYSYQLTEHSQDGDAAFGFAPYQAPPERTLHYLSQLLGDHSEELIREILECLSGADHFIPAEHLAKVDLRSTPLEEILRPYDVPWFYFEAVAECDNGTIEVDVSHGIALGAVGETFAFQRQNGRLVLVKRYERWIS